MSINTVIKETIILNSRPMNTRYIYGIKVMLVLAIGFFIQSCDKGIDNSNCLGVMSPDTLHFNIVDKATNKDLFFFDPPSYATNQLYFVIDDMSANVRPDVETSAELGKHFTLRFGGANKNGTLKAYIDEKLAFTIDYTMKEDITSKCPKYILDKITVNGNQVEVDVRHRLILLKQ